jgi:hypothetical protein
MYDPLTKRVVSYAKGYPLRPELAESTYYLYQATRDPYYLDVGRTIVDALQNYSKVECGYASVQDVTSCTVHPAGGKGATAGSGGGYFNTPKSKRKGGSGKPGTCELDDRMDSYFLSETCKYLYLLFALDDPTPPLYGGSERTSGGSSEGNFYGSRARREGRKAEAGGGGGEGAGAGEGEAIVEPGAEEEVGGGKAGEAAGREHGDRNRMCGLDDEQRVNISGLGHGKLVAVAEGGSGGKGTEAVPKEGKLGSGTRAGTGGVRAKRRIRPLKLVDLKSQIVFSTEGHVFLTGLARKGGVLGQRTAVRYSRHRGGGGGTGGRNNGHSVRHNVARQPSRSSAVIAGATVKNGRLLRYPAASTAASIAVELAVAKVAAVVAASGGVTTAATTSNARAEGVVVARDAKKGAAVYADVCPKWKGTWLDAAKLGRAEPMTVKASTSQTTTQSAAQAKQAKAQADAAALKKRNAAKQASAQARPVRTRQQAMAQVKAKADAAALKKNAAAGAAEASGSCSAAKDKAKSGPTREVATTPHQVVVECTKIACEIRSVLSAIRVEVELRGPTSPSSTPSRSASGVATSAVAKATKTSSKGPTGEQMHAAAVKGRQLQRQELFFASPAQFGPQLGLSLDFAAEEEAKMAAAAAAGAAQSAPVAKTHSDGVSAILYHPPTAAERTGCGTFNSREIIDMAGKVLLVQRGGCSFVAKARRAQQAGCVGLLVVDLEEQIEYNPAPMTNLLPRTAGAVKAGVPTKQAAEDGASRDRIAHALAEGAKARDGKRLRGKKKSGGWASFFGGGASAEDSNETEDERGGAASAAFLLTMADDGTGGSVTIPSGLLGKAAGVELLRMAQVCWCMCWWYVLACLSCADLLERV